jgi:hypothetical protein
MSRLDAVSFRVVMNGVISDHTAHIKLPRIHLRLLPRVPFVESTDVLYVVVTPQKAPEEVVTDGYEGAIYVQCGQR